MTSPAVYQAVVLRAALRIYAATGLKVSTAYTPKNMLLTAGKITGKVYRRGQYHEAVRDLTQWLDTQPRNKETQL